MVDGTPESTPGHMYFVADIFTLGIEFLIYFASLSGPALLVMAYKSAALPVFISILLVAFMLAVLSFILILIGFRRLLGNIPKGRFFLTGSRIYKWIIADRLVKIMIRSPFRHFINEYSFFRLLFYKGMGAKVDSTFLIGNGVRLPEPWAVTAGKHVLLGDDVVVSGHKVEHNTVTLGDVEIGNNVLVGARTIIFPGVKVGNKVIIGANSVITRGTIIPDGETWSGNPAVKVDMFAALVKSRS